MIQSCAMSSNVSHRPDSWSVTYRQTAAIPFSWTSLMKAQAPPSRSIVPRIMATRSGPMCWPSFVQSVSTADPEHLRAQG